MWVFIALCVPSGRGPLGQGIFHLTQDPRYILVQTTQDNEGTVLMGWSGVGGTARVSSGGVFLLGIAHGASVIPDPTLCLVFVSWGSSHMAQADL